MKKHERFSKFIIIFLIIGSVFIFTYLLKDKLNRNNVQNKNYLATTIRSTKPQEEGVKPSYVKDAFNLDELIQYGEKQFYKKDKSQFIILENISKYTDKSLKNTDSALICVGLFIDSKHETLYTKRSYNLEDVGKESHYFNIVSTGQLDLKSNELSYRVNLIDQTIQPSVFINGFLSLVNEVEMNYPKTKFISKIIVEVGEESYLYLSNQPNCLVRIEHLI